MAGKGEVAMGNEPNDQDRPTLGHVCLYVALVKALGEQAPGVPTSVAENLRRLYYKMEEYPSPPIQAMDTVRWAVELLEGRDLPEHQR